MKSNTFKPLARMGLSPQRVATQLTGRGPVPPASFWLACTLRRGGVSRFSPNSIDILHPKAAIGRSAVPWILRSRGRSVESLSALGSLKVRRTEKAKKQLTCISPHKKLESEAVRYSLGSHD